MRLLNQLCFTHTGLNFRNTARTEKKVQSNERMLDLPLMSRSWTQTARLIVRLTRRKCDDTDTWSYRRQNVRPALRYVLSHRQQVDSAYGKCIVLNKECSLQYVCKVRACGSVSRVDGEKAIHRIRCVQWWTKRNYENVYFNWRETK